MASVLTSRLISEQYTADLQGNNTAAFAYRVQADGRISANTMLDEAYTAGPDAVPRRGVYAGEGMYVLRVSARPEHAGNKLIWLVDVECGKWPSDSKTQPQDAAQDENGVFNNPLRRKCIWSAERHPEVSEVTKDIRGQAIVNSAGQSFDTPIVIERNLPVIVCQKNFATLDDIFEIQAHENKTNSKRFRGWGIDRVLFKGAEASQLQIENGIEYYTATMRFWVRPDESWQPTRLNVGWAYLDKPNGVLVPATNGDGSQATEPVLLAADGTKLAAGQPPTFRTFDVYFSTDFDDFTDDP